MVRAACTAVRPPCARNATELCLAALQVHVPSGHSYMLVESQQLGSSSPNSAVQQFWTGCSMWHWTTFLLGKGSTDRATDELRWRFQAPLTTFRLGKGSIDRATDELRWRFQEPLTSAASGINLACASAAIAAPKMP